MTSKAATLVALALGVAPATLLVQEAGNWRDTTRPAAERADALVKAMTREEKLSDRTAGGRIEWIVCFAQQVSRFACSPVDSGLTSSRLMGQLDELSYN